MFLSQLTFYDVCLVMVVGYAIVGWLIPLGIKINYGRLKNPFFKTQFSPRLSWFLFEIPNLVWSIYFLFVLNHSISIGYALFIIHYINRSIIYPLRMKTTNKVPIIISLSAFSFTVSNGYLQGICNHKYQANLQGVFSLIRLLGFALFFLGLYINIKSDQILQSAKQKLEKVKQKNQGNTQIVPESKQKKQNKYVLINQFLFKYVGSPNYFGQIIQWFGYFLVCQQFESLLFAISTLSILTAASIPRNKWNKQNIAGYPKKQKMRYSFHIVNLHDYILGDIFNINNAAAIKNKILNIPKLNHFCYF